MSEPFLTIGIASYNYERYLDKAFEQIKKQKFRDFEVLYCDDGSTDGSIDKIKGYIQKEKNMSIRLIEGNHDGIAANKNRILQHARGRYLLICDADDYMLDGCLETLCRTAQENNADCVIGGFCEINDEEKILKTHIPAEKSSKWLYTWHHGQMYRTDLIRENQIQFEGIPDDVFYLQKLHNVCINTCFVTDCIYAWCRHTNSTSGDYVGNPDWHPVKLWENIAGFIPKLRMDKELVDNTDLTYYLYKWYYFNVTDLWKEDTQEIESYIVQMQRKMIEVQPEYLQWKMVGVLMHARDTRFAKIAVIGCWILERIHLLKMVVFARKIQRKMGK